MIRLFEFPIPPSEFRIRECRTWNTVFISPLPRPGYPLSAFHPICLNGAPDFCPILSPTLFDFPPKYREADNFLRALPFCCATQIPVPVPSMLRNSPEFLEFCESPALPRASERWRKKLTWGNWPWRTILLLSVPIALLTLLRACESFVEHRSPDCFRNRLLAPRLRFALSM